ncbi:type 1 fimbrial protein [Salmonella enterica]|nr:type 1 fimbrial protein [Salmonella enterica]
MNRTKLMMMRAGNTGIPVRKLLSRQPVVTGLALLLSVGMCGEAGARTVTASFTYTVVANTCTIEAGGANLSDLKGSVTGQKGEFSLDWGTIARSDLFSDKWNTPHNVKEFGLVMKCTGSIYQPRLTIPEVRTNLDDGITYVANDGEFPLVGFGIEVSDKSSDYAAIKTAGLKRGTEILLSENSTWLTGEKKIFLKAWPTIVRSQDLYTTDQNKILAQITDITGSVTINVSYN